MQNRKINASKNKNTKLIICCVVVLAMLVSYIAALAQFADNKIYEPPTVSEESETPSDETTQGVSEEISEIEGVNDYKYYDTFEFESFPYKDSDVANGSLAIIKENAQIFPNVPKENLVKISEARSSAVYGLRNWSLPLYEEAVINIDKFIISFYEEVPKNGLIINDGYTDSVSLTNNSLVDLTTGYSVRFIIHDSSYKFSDKEFSYLRDQAFRYGVIQRYPEGKEAYTGRGVDNSIYRYVGFPHSLYMNRYMYSLEEYVDRIRTDKVIEYVSEYEANTVYVVYYVPVESTNGTTYVPLPKGDQYQCSVSGDGDQGFIVTVKFSI